MTIEYTGTGGVRKSYGPVASPAVSPDPAGAVEQKYGNIVEVEYNFTYDNLPSLGNAGADAVVPVIPANALVVACYGYISTDFNSTSGTTTIDVGLEEADGTDIDLDGLIADWGGAADGSNAGWTVGAGALVGASTGAAAGYVRVTPSVADLTAGKGRIVLRYIPAVG